MKLKHVIIKDAPKADYDLNKKLLEKIDKIVQKKEDYKNMKHPKL